MKKIIVNKSVFALAAMACLAGQAMAADAPAEPESTLTFNVGAVTEYRYRGISQSRFNPAVQGGADYTDKSGFYVGAWASTIKWIKDIGTASESGSKGPVELDLYGGYKFNVGELALDVGYLRYQYVNNTLSKTEGFKNANTDEVYAAGTYGPFTLKYSYALSDLFGQYNLDANKSSKGSGYLDLNATFDLGDGYSLVPHVGHQTVKNVNDASYTDTALALNKDLGNGLAVSATYYNTNAKSTYYYAPTEQSKNLGRSTVVLGVKYTF
jgi:uncharacterized protein (TIGR02001 family)